jgi:tetratricopeptide (TPR) repeat protein
MAPSDADYRSLMQRAVALHRAGRLSEAEANYRQLLVFHEERAELVHNLGAALAQQGKLRQARDFLTRALELETDNLKYWSVCIEVLIAMKDEPAAIQQHRRLLVSHPKLASAHNNLGNLLAQSGDVNGAGESFRAAILLEPTLASAHNNLGNLLKLDGRLAEAVESYRAALAANPNLVDAYLNMGLTLEEMGKLIEAEASFRQVGTLAPDHPDIDRQLGAVLAEQGRTAEALEAFLRHAHRNAHRDMESVIGNQHNEEQSAYLGKPLECSLVLAGGDRVAGHAINRHEHPEAIGDRWKESDPKLIVIDDFLTPEALYGLRKLCLGSNFWKKSFANGYLGALPEYGFAAPLLAQIGEELPKAFPDVFGEHPLLQLWAFKYGSGETGVNLHADFAAVNVNFWITPDEANLDSDHGGLVVWDKAAPLDWDFKTYNGNDAAIRAYLEQAGSEAIVIPYRANRAVIFDSDLFHETDTIRFRPGYENRRINVTFLYGWRAAGIRI